MKNFHPNKLHGRPSDRATGSDDDQLGSFLRSDFCLVDLSDALLLGKNYALVPKPDQGILGRFPNPKPLFGVTQ